MDTVLIPAYEPDSELIGLTKQLRAAGFAVVVVDDGSGSAYQEIFEAVAQEQAHVLHHERNRGKGAALKTGMAYIRDHMPDTPHFITCDADGQHRVEDVIRVNKMLQAGQKFVLTMRNRRKDIAVPFRSKFGNALSRVVYALLTKRFLSDNQSGLRGFAREYIDWLIQVEKDNYDYEMNVLYYAAKKAIRISTLPIDAIYINNNQSSHFHPVKDTVRIYKSLFGLAISQFISFFVAEILVLVASLIFGYEHLLQTIPGVAVIAFAVILIVDQCFVFKGVRCHDYLTGIIHQIITYSLYMLGCFLFYFAGALIPMWLAFNIAVLVCLPLRYWLYKFTFIALRTQE